jgi:hypothetical protein
MRRRANPPVPDELAARVADALTHVDVARRLLAEATRTGAPLGVRRSANAGLRRAYDEADALLRQAARSARQHSYPEWSRWRIRLSRLDTARQLHLFAESDDLGVLGMGTVRAFDTGMSGPAIGDLLHGEAVAPGAPAAYGLDMEALLDGQPERGGPALTVGVGRPEAPPRGARILPLPEARDDEPREAA